MLPMYWQQVEPMFQSFADRSDGRHTVDYFKQAVLDRQMQCWGAWRNVVKAVALTQVLDDDLGTVSVLAVAGQNAGEWVFLAENIKQWARERGSKRVVAEARPGWERLAKDYGFKKTHVILEVDV